MSFFKAIPDQPGPPVEPWRPPPEWQRPWNWVPGLSSERIVLRADDSFYVSVESFRVFPNGLAFVAKTLVHPTLLPELETERPRMLDRVQLGLELADGRRVTNHPFHGGLPEAHRGPYLLIQGGSAGDLHVSMRLWLWPLPPAGETLFVVAGPDVGLAETSVKHDITSILEAGSAAVQIWPDWDDRS